MKLIFEIKENLVSIAIKNNQDKIEYLNIQRNIEDIDFDKIFKQTLKDTISEVILVGAKIPFCLSPIAEKADYEEYFALKYPTNQSQKIVSTDNAKYNIKLVFIEEEILSEKIKSHFGKFRFLLDTDFYLDLQAYKNLWRVVLYDNEMLLLGFGREGEELLMANRFSTKNIDENAYFLMSSVSQKSTVHKDCIIEILGQSEKAIKMKNLIEPYFKKVEIHFKTLNFQQPQVSDQDRVFLNQNYLLQHI